MNFSNFEIADFEQLENLQPPNWGALIPRFQEFMQSPKSHPIKLTMDEKLIGVGTTILHEDSAWLACIIIHEDHRNKGLGAMITKELIDKIDQQKHSTIFLDATEFGFPVYHKMGFQIEGFYTHLRLEGMKPSYYLNSNIFNFDPQWESQVLNLDLFCSNENRSFVLKKHLQKAKIYLVNQKVEGFYLPTLNDGLIIANNQDAGIALLKERMQDFNYAILPEENQAAIEILKAASFVEYRKSRRMYLSKKRQWQYQYIYNRISGQLG